MQACTAAPADTNIAAADPAAAPVSSPCCNLLQPFFCLSQKVPKKGSDPGHDAREKQLQKLATRGVVLLFNAVNKAQKQKKEAEAAGLKGRQAKVSKAGFFAELKAGAKQAAAAASGSGGGAAGGAAAGGTGNADGQLVRAAAGKKGASSSGGGRQQQQQGEAGGSGWEVLGEGFPGLTGGVKMKDWDKAAAGSDDDAGGQQAALVGSDDDDEEGGW